MINLLPPWSSRLQGCLRSSQSGYLVRYRLPVGDTSVCSMQSHSVIRTLVSLVWAAGASIVLVTSLAAQNDVTFDLSHPASASAQLQQQHLMQLFQGKLKDSGPSAVEQARTEFLDYLRRSSPLASEKLLGGKMDEEELESRVGVFLRDRPEFSGASVKTSGDDPRKQVAELLRHEPSVAGTDSERLALADRFLERLGQRSPTARTELLRGKMSDEELQSRVNVFTADLRTEAAAAPVDPKVAAVRALVDAYVKANFGEQANDIVYRARIEACDVKRECVVFRKRPGKIRMHIVEEGLVIGVLGYDGTTAWRQQPGKAGVLATGKEAETLKQLARFDDPLVGFREHGTDVQLLEKPEKGPFQVHIRESDGTEMIASIDPVTNNEVSLRSRQSDGKWRELRFSDYRKVGALNLAYVQEEWDNGILLSTTRILEARTDAGLINPFFIQPVDPTLSYMDFMGGLAAINAQQRQQLPSLKQSTGGAR